MSIRALLLRRRLTGFVLAIAIGVSTSVADNFSAWKNSAKIYLNTSSTGANVSGTVTNFPVLVRLNPTNFIFSQAKSGGADIRFAKSDGATALPYQIERWVDNTTAEIWVNIDQVTGNTASQYILMYWNNSAATDLSNGSAVFDTANGFVGVWHLNESSGNAVDASANSLTGTTHSGISYLKSGGVGLCDSMDGTNNGYLDMGTSAKFNMSTNKRLTVSAWVNHGNSTMGIWEGIAGRWNWNGGTTWREFDLYGMNGMPGFAISTDGTDGTRDTLSSHTAITNGTWNYIAGTLDGTNMNMYQNGVKNSIGKTNVYFASAGNTVAGCMGVAASQNWNGKIDEIRIEKVARSDDWINLCYQNQKPNQTLVTITDNENYTTWTGSAQYTINTTSTGANTSTTITNFPLLIRLNPSNFTNFSQMQSGGADIRFANSSGTHLSYQIERFVGTAPNDTAEIWVKVDAIQPNNSTQYITMYWGNSNAVSMSNGAAVFDTANAFVAAYHLNETSGSAADATTNALNGTRTGNVAPTPGAIGTGQTFDGSGDYFQTAAFDKGNFGAAFTMSGWVYVSSGVAGPGGMWSKGNADGTWASNRVQFFLGDGGTGSNQSGKFPGLVSYGRNWVIGNTAVGSDGWHYLTYQYNPTGPARAIYIDGVSQTLTTANFGGNDNTGDLFFIGRRISADVNADFNGQMDEVVMSKTIRSADWITLCYQNQKPGSSIVCSGGAPTITVQPSGTVQAYTGDTATFTVTATGTGLSYQWQRSVNNGVTWTNVAVGVGGTSATYKFQTSIGLDSNTQFHCIVSACGAVTSNAALLLVCKRTGITAQPVNATGVNVGDSATFTIADTGSAPAHQWQRFRSGSWAALTGQTSTTCRVKIDSVDTSSQYRCVVTGAVACGSSIVNSNAVTVQVCFPPVITIQPVSQGIVNGQNVTFSVAASGKGALTYQWQRQEIGSSTWGDITGQTATSYSKTVTPSDSGAKFRCVVSASPCGSTPSSSAMITSCSLPVVTDPAPIAPIVVIGDTVRFSVSATNALGYQWQRSTTRGASWTNAPGATLLEYKFAVAASDTVQVRCIVSGGCSGFDTSAAATLTPCFAVGITTQPASQTITAGANATFSVVAVGTSLTYQWQRQENGASTWAPIALANTGSYVLTTTIPSTGNVSPDSGAQFRCIVTSTCGGTVTSSAAIANVNTTPIIFKNPSDTSVTVGNTAVFSIQARGTITSYQWQKTINSGTSWSNVTVGTGGTSAVYSFTTTIADTVNGVQFRCVVTGPSGSATSGIGRIGLCFPVAILTNPQSDTVTSGNQATFSVTATGTGLNYQWQKDTIGTGVWVAISSATNANYGFNVAAANNNWRFRCQVAGSCGTPATSGVATLSVCSPIAISANPKDTIVSLGANAIFSVTAAGTSPAYQWQRSRNGGTTWTNVTGAGATTASCTVPVDTADTGALFHCVVTGGCGTATSGPAKLTVCFPLAIPAAGQPVNQTNISPGLQAIFHVRPTGLRLSYQWQRSADGTTWSPIAGATGNDFSLIVSAADNNAKFRCRVWDTCTFLTPLTSNSATLTVCAAPEVTLQPDSPRVIVKQPAQFIITATGTGLTYQWQRMDSGSSVWNSISGATYTAYTIDSTKITDNNARFRCKIKGQCDSTISNDARLSVYVKAKAMFTMSIDGKPDSIAPAPATVRLTDLSDGAISMWIWSYGDGKRDTSLKAGEIKDHLYDSVKVYNVKLVVRGPGGIDSVSRNLTVYSKTGNPIVMTGRYIPADSSVVLVYKNFGSLNAAPAAPPTVDSIKLWFQLGSLPDTAGGAKFLKSYSLAELKTKGSVDSDKVKIDMSGSSLSTCGFMTQIVWNDGRKTLFDSLNGFLVVMRDTLRPKNNLVLSGTYAPWDTVTLHLGSVQSIDSASDSIGLWYGIGMDSVPEFVNSANPNIKWWKKDSIIAAASGNSFTYVKKDSLFNTGESDLHCAVVIRGLNKLFSDTVQCRVPIGRSRPANPIVLHAVKDTSASSIINLTWNRYTAADSVEKIRIYYRTGSAIDTGRYDFSGVQLYSLEVTPLGLGDTGRPVKNLDAKTRYYFGAQVYKKGMWSVVTAASSATDSTDTAGVSTIRNTIRINPVVFDSATNQLHISWRLDTSGMSGLFVGYSYSTKSGNWQNTTVKTIGNGVTSDTGSMVLDLGDSLLFNQDYFVYLWLKKENQQWKAPTDSSTAAVHTPAFVWQAVHADFTLVGDTLHWVNGQVRLVTPKVTINNVATMTATIQSFTDTVTSLAGFINVGQSISLAQIKKQQDLEIGLKATLSTGQKWNDVFIYRFDAANGKWLVDTSTKRDTVNGYVSVFASQLAMPFAALIDIDTPVVTVTDTSTTPVNKHNTVNYTVEVSDNVGNLRWSFQSTQGGYPYARGNSVDKTLTNGIDTARVSIDTNLVGDENGVMARFITCDGRFSDTINLSRRVVRLKSDPTGTADSQWVPLRVTAVLDSPRAGRLLRLLRLVDTTAKTPQYDNRYLRLFRWHPDATNITARDRWEEYSIAPDSVFDFISGRLMWMKTRKAVFFDFGKAVTMPQLVPLMIPLAAREYTDFAVPYHYNMRVGDIIAATRDSGAYADSLQIYSWSKGKNGSFSAQPFFIKNIQDSLGRLMQCAGDSIGFTVYNPSNVMRHLVVPPISEFMPAYKDTTAKAKTGPGAENSRWAIKVLPKTADGTVLTSVYCGYTAKRSEGKTFYPVAPSFGNIGVCVLDINSGMTYGHKIESDLSGGGCSYLLMFGNDSKSRQTISFTLERSGAFPSAMKTAAYNPITGETVDIGAGGLSVPVDGEGREYRWLFAGTAQYIASAARDHAGAKLALTSVYPNPVRRFVHLLYTLPFGRVANVDFIVLDIMGRTIWHKSIKESSITGGRRDYVWYGTASNGHRVAAGVYVLKMIASDAKGKSIGTFDRRLTVLP